MRGDKLSLLSEHRVTVTVESCAPARVECCYIPVDAASWNTKSVQVSKESVITCTQPSWWTAYWTFVENNSLKKSVETHFNTLTCLSLPLSTLTFESQTTSHDLSTQKSHALFKIIFILKLTLSLSTQYFVCSCTILSRSLSLSFLSSPSSIHLLFLSSSSSPLYLDLWYI